MAYFSFMQKIVYYENFRGQKYNPFVKLFNLSGSPFLGWLGKKGEQDEACVPLNCNIPQFWASNLSKVT